MSVFIKGRTAKTAIIATAKIRKTSDHGIVNSKALAIVGPTICPTEPAAVATPNASERFSAEVVLPITASITPNPVPAIPNPIRIPSI